MATRRLHSRTVLSLGCCLLVLSLSPFLSGQDTLLATLWPSLSALLLVFVSRSALLGLLSGAVCGAVLLSAGPLDVFANVFERQFLPIFESSWKLSAMAFTLLLGGFVALLEAGGGLHAILRHLLGDGTRQVKRMQLTVMGFGLFVFFDGLANSMLIGRIMRSAADRAGVSREKLAYLADTTSSAVACLAFVSTWIAFQLSMIQEGYAAVGREANAYALFFRSVPQNFYCWFALGIALVSILRGFNPGPMCRVEADARTNLSSDGEEALQPRGHWLFALVPVLVLSLSIPLIAYCLGAERILPFSLTKFASAYGAAEAYVPQIMVLASLLACGVAAIPVLPRGAAPTSRIFIAGVKDLLGPVAILIAAWMLGAAISELGAARHISELLGGRLSPALLPLAVFLTGACISFSTGTSWGTMAVLMPLAIPVVFHLGGDVPGADVEELVVTVIAAVFSGAVFGDHCSPFSDTTIVSAIASGVTPIDHVRTQLPFALIAALVAAVLGFLPLGFGLPVWICLPLGMFVLWFGAGLNLRLGRAHACA
ncbi:Na+/H+ antiporter NhaC family protein [Coraliomargarita parva]|uniref:Na+/H+ antiporter NhaC family protein n=1 Tax=Coraliomargarita parva TaxID=3014050 RepID=UPI0022B416A3|nr:Na+/H+ antiporter NhaC family protein [Coraliomargarita parva]